MNPSNKENSLLIVDCKRIDGSVCLYINTLNGETIKLITGLIQTIRDGKEVFTNRKRRENALGQIIFTNDREHNYLQVSIPDGGFSYFSVLLKSEELGKEWIIRVNESLECKIDEHSKNYKR